MIMVGMPGTTVNDSSSIIRNIREGKVGGVLLFEYNLKKVNTIQILKELTGSLQMAATIPLFISIDQEGGQVNRLKEKYGFKPMPSAKNIGSMNDDMYTKEIANRVAVTLHECGINLNYSPVLDIENILCPVLGKRQRCYSPNPDSITHIATLIIEAHHENHVKTVVKHFPGHGNSLSDSHLGMVDVTKTWREMELLPYKDLIGQEMVDAVMTAHIINRNLDSSGMPATLSKKIVTGILREELKFYGVVISDDMQMHAISKFYGLEESIRLCVNAGVDILMFSNNIPNAPEYTPENVHAAIKRLVLSNAISMDRINESYQRVLAMKQTM